MPGLVGFVGENEDQLNSGLLQDMLLVLMVKDWYKAEQFSQHGLGLGRVSLGYEKSPPQPLWNQDQSICVMMEGELFNTEENVRELQQRGDYLGSYPHAELVLHLYEEYGDDFISRLNGAFIIVIWDQRTNKLVIANDRLGLYPFYYTQGPERLAFASKVGALLADRKLSRSTDPMALAQFLTFDHVLGERTFLRDVKLLPPASTLVYQDGQLSIQPYWDLEFPEFYQPRRYEDYLEGLEFYLNQAVDRQKYAGPAGLLLSGGLDSRVVLAYLAKNPLNNDLHTFTFGVPGCDDARYASEVAAKAGTKHHYNELRGDYLLNLAEEGIRITEGMQNCVHMHALATLQDEIKHAKLIYKGYLGDALLGYFTFPDFFANYSDDGIIQVFNNHYPITFSESEHRSLFTVETFRIVNGNLNVTLHQVLSDTHSSILANQYYQFDLHQRQRRLGLSGIELVRSQAMVRTPFCDNDLVDFMLKAPPGLRMGRQLIRDAFVRNFPELAKVPYTETGYPLLHGRRDLLMRLNTHTRWRLRAAGLSWVPVPQKINYANYNQWFRKELQGWAEGILTSSRTYDRGYFNPNYIKQLLADHRDGKNYDKKLGALLAIELWHRRFIDGN